jgi:hypothetical protein
MGSEETGATPTATHESNQTRRSSQRRSNKLQNAASLAISQPNESEKLANESNDKETPKANPRKSLRSTSLTPVEQAETPQINTRTKKKNELNTPKQESIKSVETEASSNKSIKKDEADSKVEDVRLKWKVGGIVEARDVSNNWYKSRIIELDKTNNRAKIHFFGWNSRYDQWFGILSGDIRPVNGDNKKNEKIDKKASTEMPPQASESNENVNSEPRFPIGTQVLAKWIDDGFYPARVNRHLTKTEKIYYEVSFF